MRPPCTFGDIPAGHLDVNASRIGSFRFAHIEETFYFAHDSVERSRFIAALSLDCVAVHWIARPNDNLPLAVHRADQVRQVVLYFVRSKPADKRQAARLVRWVKEIDKAKHLIGFKTWPTFHADWIFDTA